MKIIEKILVRRLFENNSHNIVFLVIFVVPIDQILYDIRVITSSEDDSGTDSGIFMTIYGEEHRTEEFQLTATDQQQKPLFQPGSKDHFSMKLDDVGRVNSF